MACSSGENVLCNVWLSIGDLACFVTASYNGLQIAWVGVVGNICCPDAAIVVVDVVIKLDLLATLEVSADGVGGAGGVGTDSC